MVSLDDWVPALLRPGDVIRIRLPGEEGPGGIYLVARGGGSFGTSNELSLIPDPFNAGGDDASA